MPGSGNWEARTSWLRVSPLLSAKGLRVVNSILVGATSLLLVACSTPRHGSSQTDYPTTIVARVANRTTGLQHSPIPVVKPDGELVRSKARIDYELRANDGTILIVQTTSEFPVGACVILSGYADGPSRTHFSFGRAQLEPSDRCQ